MRSLMQPVRVLLCGSVPPEWGGASGGGVGEFHRVLIEELGNTHYGVDIAGLIPFNLAPQAHVGVAKGRIDEVAAAVRSVREARWDREELRRRALDAIAPNRSSPPMRRHCER
jgi:hypothetical protein